MIHPSPPTPDPLALYGAHGIRRVEMTSRAGATYVIHISVPPTGRASRVIVMLDGETFPVIREILRYQAGATPNDPEAEPMLVAIGYPDTSRRVLDYSPHALADDGRTGGGPVFRHFILETLLPWIASEFDAAGSHRTLMGHSMGGMFVIDTLIAAPEAFHTYVASSPSVWWGERYLSCRVDAAVSDLVRHSPPLQADAPPRRILMSTAEYELSLSPAEQRLPADAQETLLATRQARDMIEGNRRIAQRLAQWPGCSVSFTTFAGETHRSVWPRAVAVATRDEIVPPGPRI